MFGGLNKEEKEFLSDLSKRMESISKRLEAQDSSLKESFSNLKKDLDEIRIESDFIHEYKKELENIKSSRKDFEESVEKFSIMQMKLYNKIVDNIKEDINKSLIPEVKKLQLISVDIKRYEELKEKIASFEKDIAMLKANLDKVNTIASGIKKEDFELTKFANKIFEADKEKIRLMKDNEALQKLISIERRRSKN
ncbi:MAG: hypothetical protein Q8O89_06385 [Nanoarchaeota archaeon]|nr:hypothetical protein [Nanoarchaeota archaeon]